MRSIRRSRSTAGLLAVAFLIAASSCADDSTDLTLPPAAPWGAEPVTTVTATAVEVSAPFEAQQSEPRYLPMTEWLVPWEDGFLAVGVRPSPTPLPDELPPEVAELFPPEVIELFPDGLPATLEEATEILTEAGLFNVVMDILDEHPEAMDALQAEPAPGPELVAMWSIDGDEWTSIELATPADLGWPAQLTVAGDRLNVAGAVPSDDEGGQWTVTVASTTDLANWDTAELTIPVPEELPDAAQMWISPVDVAADDEHWVTRIMIDIEDPTSTPPYSEPQPQLWSGAWDGDPTLIEGDESSWVLASTSEGFLDLGRSARFSPDGQTWTEGEPLGPNENFVAEAPLGDGVLAITSAAYGHTSILLLDATGTTVAEVTIPELGDHYFVWGGSGSPAFVAESVTEDAFERTIVVEYEDFELTQEFGAVAAYRLVDLATGDIVAEESVDLQTTEIGENGPFEHLAESEFDVTITDPDTGETIVEIPQWVVGRAWQDLEQDTEQDIEQPTYWLLATNDGETWLLDGSEPDEFNPPMLTAVNGSTVLTGTLDWGPSPGTWQRYTITE